MIKKKIEGYFVRECGVSTFSENEFEDKGWIEDGYWHSRFHTDAKNSEHPLHNLYDLLMLSKYVDDDRPYRMKITVELEAVDYKSRRKEAIQRYKEQLKEQLAMLEKEG